MLLALHALWPDDRPSPSCSSAMARRLNRAAGAPVLSEVARLAKFSRHPRSRSPDGWASAVLHEQGARLGLARSG